MKLRKIDLPLCLLVGIGLALVLALGAALVFPRPRVAFPSEAVREAKKVDEAPAASTPAHASPSAAASPSEAARRGPARLSVDSIAGKFGGKDPKPPRPDPAPPKPSAPALRADWLRAVGSFEDREGLKWILLKDERRGLAIKLRSDGAASEEGRVLEGSAGVLVVEIDSKKYSIGGR